MAAKTSTHGHDLSGFATLSSLKVPRTTRTLGRMIAIAIPLLLVLLFAVKWVQTAPGRGDVIALNPEDRVQQVTALVPGRVEKWFVVDGQLVKQGDPIARIIDNDPDLLTRLAAEREQVVAQIEAAQQAMATARLDVNRSSQLYAEGLAARRDYEATQIKVAELNAKLAEARAKLSKVDIALNRQSAQLVRAPRDGRILWHHIMPNSMAPLIVQLSFVFAYAVLSEAVLSFLGLSAPPTVPSWGVLIAEGRTYLREAAWLTVIPGIAIAVTVLGLNLLGDGLRDVLDPRMKVEQ